MPGMSDEYQLERAIHESMALAEALHRGDRFGETEEYVSEIGFMLRNRLRVIYQWWDERTRPEEGEGKGNA